MLEQHKGRDNLPADLIRPADHAGLSYCRMSQEGSFYFDRANPMASDLDDLVCTAREPYIAVFIDMGRVARVLNIRDFFPVVLSVSFRLAPQGRGQPREGTFDHHD